MQNFERTEEDFIKQKASELIRDDKIGEVISVTEHTKSDDSSNFEVNVIVDGDEQLSNVPIVSNQFGDITIPKVGDYVLVSFIDGNTTRPVITGGTFTNNSRPPLGKAGMTRKRIQSGETPLGNGDLFKTEYTSYDKSVTESLDESDGEPEPEEVYLRWTKRQNETADPTEESVLPFKFEYYESPKDNEAYFTVEMNKINSMDAADPWGFKIDMKTGEMKWVDPNRYGIKTDGFGNFTWSYRSLDEEQSNDKGSLNL